MPIPILKKTDFLIPKVTLLILYFTHRLGQIFYYTLLSTNLFIYYENAKYGYN